MNEKIKNNIIIVPSVKEAEKILKDGGKSNPGNWIDHSLYVADAARRITEKLPDLNSEIAYSLGCMHDIGRCYGFSYIKHTIDGYKYMMKLHYPYAARICLTHSFPFKEIKSYTGKNDCEVSENEFIQNFINNIKYSKYDKLIQLCDALGSTNGFCLLEKRLIDVFLRHGVYNFMKEKLKSVFKIKQEFENSLGHSIYELLPGVKDNTFK